MTTLAEQIATLESRLAAYESRKVPLSADDACRIWEDDPDDRIGVSCLAVARAALVAAESPAGVEAAFEVWRKNYSGSRSAMLAVIRAAHDAAIDGGCGAARESDEVAKLREQVATLEWDRDAFVDSHGRLEKERDALRRQLDALTRPIDGVEELGRIGWRASLKDERANPEIDAGDIRQAQAIASRVIGALRDAMARGYRQSYLDAFDAAVASLKIEPAKVEATPKRGLFVLPYECHDPANGYNANAIRDRIREIERRLEAGGL